VVKSDLPYIATDDRGIERVAAKCTHRRCPPGNCLAYTEATVTPTPADEEVAKHLVAEGWWSTSAKYRTIRRWKEKPPTVEELIRPELLNTFHGKRLAAALRPHIKYNYGSYMDPETRAPYPDDLFEDAQLSPSLFRAFKAAGGDCGR
jgi:hypothetical protein